MGLQYKSIEKLESDRIELIEKMKAQKFYEGFKDTLTKLYTKSGHFIYELIQNAEDSEATALLFDLSNDKLVFSHDGKKLFCLEDIDSITSVGNSTKTDNGNSIGKFGVGFKSVFEYTNTPTVHSGDFHFEIRDMFVPHSIADKDLQHYDNTVFYLPFDRSEKSKQSCFLEIMGALKDLPSETLLFLRHINTIVCKFGTEQIVLSRKENNALLAPKGLCTLSKTNSATVHYVRFFDKVKVTEKNNQISEENKEKEIEIAIAFKAEYGDKNGWSIQPILSADGNPNGKVFTFFPCEKEYSGLCFHIHAPFALTVDREKLREEEANSEIKERLELLLEKSLDSIKESKLLNMDFLKTLPNDDDALGSYEIFKTVKEKFNNEPFTPMENGSFASAKDKFRSQKQISVAFDDSDMNFLFGTEGKTYWIKNPRQINQRDDKFLQGLDCENFGIDDFLEKYVAVQKDYDDIQKFLENKNAVMLDAQKQKINRYTEIKKIFANKNPKWYVKLYDQLWKFIEDDNYYEKINSINTDIRNLPLCLCASNVLQRFKDCYLLPKDNKVEAENINLVHSDICKEIKNGNWLHSFFARLEINEFSETEVFKANFQNFVSGEKSVEKFIELFHKYLDLKKDFDTNYFKNLSSDYKIFKSENGDFRFGRNIFIQEAYYPDNKIENISVYYTDETVARNLNIAPLSPEYLDYLRDDTERNEFVEFIKVFGCKTDISIITTKCYKNPYWTTIWRESDGERETSGGTDIDFTIQYLDSVLKNPTVKKFEFILSLLATTPLRQKIDWHTYDISLCYYCKSASYSIKKYPSQLTHILKSAKWVAQEENGKVVFVTPENASVSKLPIKDDYLAENLSDWLLYRLDFDKREKENQAEYQRKIDDERKHNEDLEKVSNELGFSSNVLSELEKAKKEGVISSDGIEILNILTSLRKAKESKIEVYKRNSELPSDATRFQEKVRENFENAEDITYEKRERSVRENNAETKDQAKIKLRSRYTDHINGTMICQLCKNPMPFKDKQGLNFFYTRQLFSSKLFEKESDENYIALCPTCEAKFKVYMSQDEDKQQNLLDEIKQFGNEKTDYSVSLDADYELHFDKKHILAVYTCLGGEIIQEEKKKVLIKVHKSTKPEDKNIPQTSAFCIKCNSIFTFAKNMPIVSCDKCRTSYQNTNGVIGKILNSPEITTSLSQKISFEQLKRAIEITRVESNGYVLVALLAISLESVVGSKPDIKMRKLVNMYLDKLDVIETPAFSVRMKHIGVK